MVARMTMDSHTQIAPNSLLGGEVENGPQVLLRNRRRGTNPF